MVFHTEKFKSINTMKKLLSLILTLLVLLSLVLISCEPEDLGTSFIYGIVSDKATGEPIKSAGVELLPIGLKTVTGSDGSFEFANLKAGNYQVYITQSGYVEVKSSNIELAQGKSLQRDVQMELLPPALRVVNDSRKDISELDFGSAETDVARSFNLFNDGAESLEWEITYTADWVKLVSKTEGVLKAGGTQALIVTIDRDILKSGINTTTLHITSNNGSKQLTLKADNSKNLPTLNTLQATSIMSTSAVLNGEILTEGTPKYTERGFVYSLSSMPTIENTISKLTAAITDFKKYSVTVTDLIQNQTFYVRAYAINEIGIAYSTNEIKLVPTSVLPQIDTKPVTDLDIEKNSVKLNATILEEGNPCYTEKGFIYSTFSNLTLNNSEKIKTEGTTKGDYFVVVGDLKTGIQYFACPYLIHEDKVIYGDVVDFIFPVKEPKVQTLDANKVSETSASFNGSVLEIGNPNYTECGIIYGTFYSPSLDKGIKLTASKTGIGKYTVLAENLEEGGYYSYCAYAITENGVVYGDVKNFTVGSPYYTKLEYANLMVCKEDLGALDWETANNQCDNLILAGYDDWYLPTIIDLAFIKNNSSEIGGLKGCYWSSTAHNTKDTYQHKQIGTSICDESYHLVSERLKVRCVRRIDGSRPEDNGSNESTEEVDENVEYYKLPTFTYTSSGYGRPGTSISIPQTSTYRVYKDLGTKTLTEAVKVCEDLKYGGFADWFLPSVEILNAMYQNRATILGFKSENYWSSGSLMLSGEYYKSFADGNTYTEIDLSNKYRVRCVRKE